MNIVKAKDPMSRKMMMLLHKLKVMKDTKENLLKAVQLKFERRPENVFLDAISYCHSIIRETEREIEKEEEAI